MVNAARARDPHQRPTRLIFDEGHHVFDAADSTFAATLSGQEAIELRRWIIGPEREARGRRRGLSARLADLASYDEAGAEAIAAACKAGQQLPSDGWLQRLAENAPYGPVEALLAAVRAATYARDESGGIDAGYGIETEASGLPGEVIEAAGSAAEALAGIRVPLIRLGGRLEAILADPPDWLDAQGRARIEGARFALTWRIDLIAAWESLLARLGGPADPPEFVDWLAVDRSDAREFDVAIHRRWLDPMKPFARVVLEPAHGVLLTSATLTDRTTDADAPDAQWASAIARSGAAHIEGAPLLSAATSPFDYAARAEVLIVTDIAKGDLPALAGAYARLIEASGGGVLGLFTAIRRLRAVYGRIADRLARAGLPVYAQHVDPIDTGTLVDIFRDDPRASLLGTDALRDGVDVPGHSLRCVVLEQVPWPRPDILHKARRAAGGGSRYDDRIIRARLAQAFGRLIRSKDDAGHFVVLSPAFPSRLLSAFPPGTPVLRVTLDQALQRVTAGVWGQAVHACARSLAAMKILGLLRHAKSDWEDNSQRDFDRGLNARGRKGARLIGKQYPGARHRMGQADRFAGGAGVKTDTPNPRFPEIAPEYDQRLYLASYDTIIETIEAHAASGEDEADAILISGHNPGLQDVLLELGSRRARRTTCSARRW